MSNDRGGLFDIFHRRGRKKSRKKTQKKLQVTAERLAQIFCPIKLTQLNKSEERPKSSFLSGRIRVECYHRVISKYKDFFSRLVTTVFADKQVIIIYYFEII